MPENRFFLDALLRENTTCSFPEEEFHHLKVMRKTAGDTVEIVNGRNQLAEAKITALSKKGAEITLFEVKTTPPPSRQLILIQAYLRPKNLDLVIEKGTELGATAFWLFPADRSEKSSLSESQSKRLHHLTLSALKQCGRLDLPPILHKPPLSSWEESPPGAFLYGSLSTNTMATPSSQDTYLLIGPEKGLTPDEENTLKNTLKATPISLHPNILRAETAALCALSIHSNLRQ